jgi:hypothetical protein
MRKRFRDKMVESFWQCTPEYIHFFDRILLYIIQIKLHGILGYNDGLECITACLEKVAQSKLRPLTRDLAAVIENCDFFQEGKLS